MSPPVYQSHVGTPAIPVLGLQAPMNTAAVTMETALGFEHFTRTLRKDWVRPGAVVGPNRDCGLTFPWAPGLVFVGTGGVSMCRAYRLKRTGCGRGVPGRAPESTLAVQGKRALWAQVLMAWPELVSRAVTEERLSPLSL